MVTAVHAPYAPFLPAAYSALRAQTHRRWRWVVQVDGVKDLPVRTALAVTGALDDPRVVVECNRAFVGPAVTRNIALARAGAPLLQNLDADDQLEPAALAVLVAAMTAHPEVGFAVGRARDLFPDGSLREHPLHLLPGVQPRRALSQAWLDDPADHRLPVHPAGVMWRRDLVVHLGGWTALLGMEDTGLLMAASAVTEGVVVDADVLRYRKHPRQRSVRTKRSKFTGGGGSCRAHPGARGGIGGRTEVAPGGTSRRVAQRSVAMPPRAAEPVASGVRRRSGARGRGRRSRRGEPGR